MRLIKGCTLACTTLALLSGKAQAQDLFDSTNTTSLRYNYVEAQYLFNLDASPPVLATALLDVWDNWSILGEFLNVDIDDAAEQFGADSQTEVTAEATLISVGALYHQRFSLLTQSDWIAGFLLGWGEVRLEIPQLFVDEEDSFSFQELFAGVRKTLAPKLEGEVTLNYSRSSDLDVNEITADVTLVYRVLRSFDVALAGNDIGGDDGNNLGIGLRYTW